MKITILILILAFFQFVGCKDMSAKNNIESNAIQNKLGNLPLLLSLPKQPSSVKWKLEKAHGDNSYLVALFKFSEHDYNYIIENSDEFDNKINDRMLVEFFDHWLPDDAKTNIAVKKKGAVYELIDVRGLKPNLFTQTEHSPYIHGAITPLNNGYIWVVLDTL